MLLAAHAIGLGSLWFTLFDAEIMRNILDVKSEKVYCWQWYASVNPAANLCGCPRKDALEKTRFIR